MSEVSCVVWSKDACCLPQQWLCAPQSRSRSRSRSAREQERALWEARPTSKARGLVVLDGEAGGRGWWWFAGMTGSGEDEGGGNCRGVLETGGATTITH